MKSEKECIDKMLNVLRKAAQGNYDFKLEISDENKDLDDVFIEINTLIDKLKSNTTRQEYVDKRINHITAVIKQVANGVYTESCDLSAENNIFDSLGIGVNMMIEDIQFGIEKFESQKNKLIQSNKEYEALYNEYKDLNKVLLTAKDKAEESDRLKSAFLANMSHEIRTPMNGILGFTSLLKEANLSSEKQQDYIGLIEKSGARMLNILNDIISISRIEAGVVEVNCKTINIQEEQENLYAFFKPEVDTKNLEFFFNSAVPLKNPMVRTDKDKFLSILSNLIKNAIKYTVNGSIEYGYNKKGSFLEFYVKDTGIGIARVRQDVIFERFIQADIEDKLAKQGAGLGLSISKAYVEMLGGEIWLESKKEIGSIFYFTIPLDTETILINKPSKSISNPVF